MKQWHVYILKCFDNTYYTGITNNLEKRINVHNARKGAIYTRGRLPVTLLYSEIVDSKSSALKREHEIKKLSRIEKENLMASKKKSIKKKLDNTVKIHFPSKKSADLFIKWFCNSGEQSYWACFEGSKHEKDIVSFDYWHDKKEFAKNLEIYTELFEDFDEDK